MKTILFLSTLASCIAAEPLHVISPAASKSDLAYLWGKPETDRPDSTDWTVSGILVTVSWDRNGAPKLVSFVATKKMTWAEMAAALKIDAFTASKPKDLTPLRSSWTLSHNGNVSWNAKGTKSAQGAITFDIVNLSPP